MTINPTRRTGFVIIGITGGLLLASAGGGLAQTPPLQVPPAPAPASQAKPDPRPLVALRVQVTISRFEGDKRISSMPFTVWVNANDRSGASVNTATRVPVSRGGTPPAFEYQNVGTTISCTATVLDDGRFSLNLNVSDTSVTRQKDSADAPPLVQSFASNSTLLLRDGQNAQYVAASDKVSGEQTRVDVTVTVLK